MLFKVTDIKGDDRWINPIGFPIQVRHDLDTEFEKHHRRNAEGQGLQHCEFSIADGHWRARYEQRRGFWVLVGIQEQH